jgi:heterodisulfide reductase subunit D
MTIFDHYFKEKKHFLDKCVRCGLCAEECPILPYTEINALSPEDIQEDVYDFMNDGIPNQNAYTKAFACMECFKCTTDTCPEELNPMLVNELIKNEYFSRGLAERAEFGDQQQPNSVHRVLASVQVSASDYRKITEPSNKQHARCIFFPGCNVYFQPEKILNALDIMDAIGDDYAFLPGLDYCCGDGNLFFGDTEKGGQQAESLIAAISDFQPETVVLWCPTCLCRFNQTIAPVLDVPFQILSFPQYLAANMNKLRLSDSVKTTVTLHEACKSVYTGLDLNGPREVLLQLPGVKLIDMKHRGSCCGSWAIYCFPESGTKLRENRLKEAVQTGAEHMATVCHYCNQTFAGEAQRYDFGITNYVNLVAEAMGIHREDKFKKYALWADLDRILKDANEYILASSFQKERIIEVLQEVFVK